jgi:ERCC4-type nuclease
MKVNHSIHRFIDMRLCPISMNTFRKEEYNEYRMSATIIYDARESRSVNDDMFQRYTEFYNKKYGYNITFQKKQITTNDFIIIIDNQLYAVIERKTIPDFCGSIINNRLDKQMNDLLTIRDVKGSRIFLLLEGQAFCKQTTKFRHMTFQQIDAKKRSIMGKGIPIMLSRDSEYTVEQIVLLAADACRDSKNLRLPARAKVAATIDDIVSDKIQEWKNALNDTFSMMECKAEGCEQTLDVIQELREKYEAKIEKDLKKISSSYARDVQLAPVEEQAPQDIPIESLTPKCATPNETIHQMWCAIPSVSNKSAPILARKYTIKEFIAAPNADEIAELEFDSGMKFGVEKANKIVKAIKDLKTQVKILSQIRSVTPILAKKLIDDFTFAKLDEIGADYKFRNKRIKTVAGNIKAMINYRMT